MIGSLLWDGGLRQRWRQNRLDLSNLAPAFAPIRYGRRSETRSDTFTMVLDPECPIGRAVIVPAQADVRTFDALLDEARALWKAEAPNSAPGALSAGWGSVGAMFSVNVPTEFKQAWSRHFQEAATAVEPVATTGMLRVPWPTQCSDGMPADFDVLLATATRPTSPPPTSQAIARAWADQSFGREHYLIENMRRGIRTHDDPVIWDHLKDFAPEWMSTDLVEEIDELLADDD